MTICAVTIISPIRLHYTGNYDQGEDNEALRIMTGQSSVLHNYNEDNSANSGSGGSDGDDLQSSYMSYLWTYVVFTYIFTFLTSYIMLRQTIKVLRVRQKYLGQQNSITDRTIRLSGIPPELRTESALKDYIETLGIGSVRSLELCRHWGALDEMFQRRKKIIRKLEHAWSSYLGPTWRTDNLKNLDKNMVLPFSEDNRISSRSIPLGNNPADSDANDGATYHDDIEQVSEEPNSPHDNLSQIATTNAALQLGVTKHTKYKRPKERLGLWGIFGEEVDVIDYYTNELEMLDSQIELARKRYYTPTDTAFVTMDSVASAQMAAQAVLDPRPNRLLARPAPAPHDIIWNNLYMRRRERIIRTYTITIIIAILTVVLIFPVSYLASFLELKTIKRLRPALGKMIERSEWATTFVTGILPPLIFTLFNFLLPYLYWYLADLQGFVSYGEVELSVISKNFFYVFFNMFFVFTVAGNYWTFLKDTTQLAYKLAESLMKFSLFYIDLVILQGIAMFPLRLLQIGSILRIPFSIWWCQSPRDYINRYRPPVFNYGINLPQPILIFIIVILYSVISTKILFFGTIYFFLGFMTYKYQLMFTMVHPQHSTGQSWVLIMRRVCLGVIIFHLTMAGILALQKAYFLATMLAPLPVATFLFWYNFEESYVPLSYFIALTAIETFGSGNGVNSPRSFLDESEEEDSRPTSEDRSEEVDNLEANGSSSTENGDETNGTHNNQHGDDISLISRQNKQKKRRSFARRFISNGIPNLRFRSFSVSKTLDEERERHQKYVNPNLVKPLDGPWIGVEGSDGIIMANNEGTIKRKIHLEEWE